MLLVGHFNLSLHKLYSHSHHTLNKSAWLDLSPRREQKQSKNSYGDIESVFFGTQGLWFQLGNEFNGASSEMCCFCITLPQNTKMMMMAKLLYIMIMFCILLLSPGVVFHVHSSSSSSSPIILYSYVDHHRHHHIVCRSIGRYTFFIECRHSFSCIKKLLFLNIHKPYSALIEFDVFTISSQVYLWSSSHDSG